MGSHPIGALALGLVLVACAPGGEASESFARTPLRGTLPAETALEILRAWTSPAGATVEPGEELGEFLVTLELGEDAWEPDGPRTWRASADFGFDLRRLEANACALEGTDLPAVDSDDFEECERGYVVEQRAVAARTKEGEGAPGTATLRVHYWFARLRSGADGAVWRPLVGGHTGEGIAVPSGTAVEFEADVLPGAHLRFFAVAEPLALGFDGLEECDVTFRVELDGELVLEEPEKGVALGGGRWHEVALPPEGKRAASLRLSVSGDPALAAFLSPSLGPAREAAAKADTRPDVILLLVDTLRADGLSFYGGDPEHAPRLNAFGESCVRFRRAWSPASWTLPSQSSMLSGLQPEEHGTVYASRSLPEGVVTLAEHLRDAGYRTGATTEALFVARRFGMDQGFEFFFENRRRLFRRTLEAATDFLASDDGRPTFFFFHTYRVHTPYRLGPEEDRGPMRRFMADWEAYKERGVVDEAKAAELGRRLHELYYGGVKGLDDVLGPWLSELEASGYFDRGFLILTSDHGEALQEHGVVGHGGRHWEERIRIPMLARGPGLIPGVAEEPVTLVDLAPTISLFAGVAPHPTWSGASMFRLDPGRVVFTFNSDQTDGAITAHERDYKVAVRRDPAAVRAAELLAAFDLAADPGEEKNLGKEAPSWAVRLLRDNAATIEHLLQPKFEADEIDLSEEERAELRALGYGGD